MNKNYLSINNTMKVPSLVLSYCTSTTPQIKLYVSIVGDCYDNQNNSSYE